MFPPHKEHRVSFTETNQLMLYGKQAQHIVRNTQRTSLYCVGEIGICLILELVHLVSSSYNRPWRPRGGVEL